jgi:hypothetical protein
MTIDISLEPVRPWLTIWTKPKQTIRQIVDYDVEYYVMPLAAASGIFQALDNASERAMGDTISLPILLALVFLSGAIGGVITIYLSGAIFRWTGSWFGGQASSQQVRAAVAWASIPDVLMLLIYIPIILFAGRDWFTSSAEFVNTPVGVFIVLVLGAMAILLVFWRLFLMVACLAEVHRFTARRALATLFTGAFVLIVPIIALIFGCGLMSSAGQ